MFSTTQLSIRVILLALSLPVVASNVHASDEHLSYEAAEKAVAVLIQSVGPVYECDISVVSLRTAPPEVEDLGNYFVVLEALGQGCDEAHKVLAYRGKGEGLMFFLEKPIRDRTTIPEQERKHQNFDLIHEIDPPNDT